MQILYHHPLCPLSRQIRILLKELKIEFRLIKEDYWLNNKEFLQKSPANLMPLLENEQGEIIVGSYPIIEYLNDSFNDFFLMPKTNFLKAEVRKYISWFNDKFYKEVSKILLEEKMIRLLTKIGEPRSVHIREAKTCLLQHFKFMTTILSSNSFIISEKISCADIVAASHISIIDYFGEINWDNWEVIKQWYSVIKSRPSFQTVLADRVPGFPPPVYYDQLDF